MLVKDKGGSAALVGLQALGHAPPVGQGRLTGVIGPVRLVPEAEQRAVSHVVPDHQEPPHVPGEGVVPAALPQPDAQGVQGGLPPEIEAHALPAQGLPPVGLGHLPGGTGAGQGLGQKAPQGGIYLVGEGLVILGRKAPRGAAAHGDAHRNQLRPAVPGAAQRDGALLLRQQQAPPHPGQIPI